MDAVGLGERGDLVDPGEELVEALAGPDRARAWLHVDGRPEGAASANGRVRGCYLHGLFAADGFRAAYLAAIGGPQSELCFEDGVEATLDALADHVEAHLDLDLLLHHAGEIA